MNLSELSLRNVILAAILSAGIFYYAYIYQEPLTYLFGAIVLARTIHDFVKLYVRYRRNK